MPLETVTLGIGGGYMTGSHESDWEETFIDPTIPEVRLHGSTDVSSLNVRGGILLRVMERAFFSVTAEKPVTFALTDSLGEVDVDQPISLRGGAIYIPGNAMRSVFVAGIYWRDDGSTTIDGEDTALHTSWGFRAGVENHIPGGPAARVGFCYDGSPIARELDRMTFTAGVGVEISEWNLDFGAGFSPVSWRQTEVPAMISFVPGDSLSVEETTTRVMMSLGRTF
jgi:hypothetical protein